MTRNEEILTILQEECAEVIQAISKIRRFGLSDNEGELKKEICDVLCMIELMKEFDVVPLSFDEQMENIFQKRQKLKKFSRIFENSGEIPYEEMSEHTRNSIDWFGSPNGA